MEQQREGEEEQGAVPVQWTAPVSMAIRTLVLLTFDVVSGIFRFHQGIDVCSFLSMREPVYYIGDSWLYVVAHDNRSRLHAHSPEYYDVYGQVVDSPEHPYSIAINEWLQCFDVYIFDASTQTFFLHTCCLFEVFLSRSRIVYFDPVRRILVIEQLHRSSPLPPSYPSSVLACYERHCWLAGAVNVYTRTNLAQVPTFLQWIKRYAAVCGLYARFTEPRDFAKFKEFSRLGYVLPDLHYQTTGSSMPPPSAFFLTTTNDKRQPFAFTGVHIPELLSLCSLGQRAPLFVFAKDVGNEKQCAILAERLLHRESQRAVHPGASLLSLLVAPEDSEQFCVTSDASVGITVLDYTFVYSDSKYCSAGPFSSVPGLTENCGKRAPKNRKQQRQQHKQQMNIIPRPFEISEPKFVQHSQPNGITKKEVDDEQLQQEDIQDTTGIVAEKDEGKQQQQNEIQDTAVVISEEERDVVDITKEDVQLPVDHKKDVDNASLKENTTQQDQQQEDDSIILQQEDIVEQEGQQEHQPYVCSVDQLLEELCDEVKNTTLNKKKKKNRRSKQRKPKKEADLPEASRAVSSNVHGIFSELERIIGAKEQLAWKASRDDFVSHLHAVYDDCSIVEHLFEGVANLRACQAAIVTAKNSLLSRDPIVAKFAEQLDDEFFERLYTIYRSWALGDHRRGGVDVWFQRLGRLMMQRKHSMLFNILVSRFVSNDTDTETLDNQAFIRELTTANRFHRLHAESLVRDLESHCGDSVYFWSILYAFCLRLWVCIPWHMEQILKLNASGAPLPFEDALRLPRSPNTTNPALLAFQQYFWSLSKVDDESKRPIRAHLDVQENDVTFSVDVQPCFQLPLLAAQGIQLEQVIRAHVLPLAHCAFTVVREVLVHHLSLNPLSGIPTSLLHAVYAVCTTRSIVQFCLAGRRRAYPFRVEEVIENELGKKQVVIQASVAYTLQITYDYVRDYATLTLPLCNGTLESIGIEDFWNSCIQTLREEATEACDSDLALCNEYTSVLNDAINNIRTTIVVRVVDRLASILMAGKPLPANVKFMRDIVCGAYSIGKLYFLLEKASWNLFPETMKCEEYNVSKVARTMHQLPFDVLDQQLSVAFEKRRNMPSSLLFANDSCTQVFQRLRLVVLRYRMLMRRGSMGAQQLAEVFGNYYLFNNLHTNRMGQRKIDGDDDEEEDGDNNNNDDDDKVEKKASRKADKNNEKKKKKEKHNKKTVAAKNEKKEKKKKDRVVADKEKVPQRPLLFSVLGSLLCPRKGETPVTATAFLLDVVKPLTTPEQVMAAVRCLAWDTVGLMEATEASAALLEGFECPVDTDSLARIVALAAAALYQYRRGKLGHTLIETIECLHTLTVCSDSVLKEMSLEHIRTPLVQHRNQAFAYLVLYNTAPDSLLLKGRTGTSDPGLSDHQLLQALVDLGRYEPFSSLYLTPAHIRRLFEECILVGEEADDPNYQAEYEALWKETALDAGSRLLRKVLLGLSMNVCVSPVALDNTDARSLPEHIERQCKLSVGKLSHDVADALQADALAQGALVDKWLRQCDQHDAEALAQRYTLADKTVMAIDNVVSSTLFESEKSPMRPLVNSMLNEFLTFTKVKVEEMTEELSRDKCTYSIDIPFTDNKDAKYHLLLKEP